MAKKEKNSTGDQGGANAEIASSGSATEGRSEEEPMTTTREAVGSATSIMPALGPQVEPAVPEKLSAFQDVTSNSDDYGPGYIERLIEKSEDGKAALADGESSYGIKDSVMNELVNLVNTADGAGDDNRISVAYRIRRDCFGNDIGLMQSRSHYKSVKYTSLVTHPLTRPDESTIRGWIYASLVHEDLENNSGKVDSSLTVSLLKLLYRTKDPVVWRRLAPEVAGMKVKDAKDYIKAQTGKKTSESTSDMILRVLRNPLRAMAEEQFVSLITNPDLLTARLNDVDEVHRILGEFGKIRKPVEDFLVTMATFQSILNKLTGSHAA